MNVDFIIKGDSLESLKIIEDNSIDLGITSPPYNKGINAGQIVKRVKYDIHDDNLSEDVYQKQQIEVLNECYRIIKPGGSFFYNHKCRWSNGSMIHPIIWLYKTDWIVKQEIIWNRKITGNLRGWRFWQTDERIYWLYKPNGNDNIGKEIKSKHARLSAIWDIMPERNNPHPAPFPVSIPSRIIYSIFDDAKNKIVIDPYFGSGTVGVASKLFGCNYIGIEISDNYIDIAKNRIDNFESYRSVYDVEINKHQIKGITYSERKNRKLRKNT